MTKKQVRKQQIPMESVYPLVIPPDYTYIKTNFTYLFYSHIVYSLLHLVLGIGFFQIIGSQKTQGRKNLRLLKNKGFITVANHCHIFDVVLTGLAVVPRRPWFASVQRNFEAPYYRKLFRDARGFPIPDGLMGLRKIVEPVVTSIKQGQIIHLFPEQELWHLHQQIDHFQRGAFYLAHQANCPVLPIIHLFKPRTFFGRKISDNILKITTVIGEPVYPPVPIEEGQAVDLKSVQEMSDRVHKWMKTKMTEYHQDS